MESAVDIKEIPRIHVFCPDDDLHLDGLVAMLILIDSRKLSDDEMVWYYKKIRNPQLDFDKIHFPNDRHYILEPSLISVGSLRNLARGNYFGSGSLFES